MTKHLRHPATLIAAAALFVALGGGAVAYAGGLISGSHIKNHSIPAKKLTKAAIKSLHGQPGGTIISWNANASASPSFAQVGKALGDTISAECGISSGDVTLTVDVTTSDGSWGIDYSYMNTDNGTSDDHVNSINVPAGTVTGLFTVDSVEADSGGNHSDHQLDFVQLKPASGSMIWHETASTNTNSCHFSMQTVPEKVTFVAGASRKWTKLNPNASGLLATP